MVQQPRAKAFPIDRGICQFDFNDYYAVLGLPITADASQVRKGYLLIAKKLHPDVYGRSPEDKEQATRYLAKMVNPAYQVLSQERERTEYSAILKLLAKRLIKRSQRVSPQSDAAKKLMYNPITINYDQTVAAIANVQYDQIDKILEFTAQLSELNLVYVLAQEGYKFFSTEAPPVAPAKSSYGSSYKSGSQTNSQIYQTKVQPDDTVIQQKASKSASSTPQSTNQSGSQARPNPDPKQATPQPKANGSVHSHIQQAEECISQKQWSSALKELKSALQIDCNSSKCHALLGVVYLNQKLAGMAKVSFKQALKLNPQEPVALQNISRVDGTATKDDAKPKEQGKKGGLFGWLGQ